MLSADSLASSNLTSPSRAGHSALLNKRLIRTNPNPRYKSLSFDIAVGATLHGFIGYFHSTLYKDIIISTEPRTESVGMFSWFPLYLPLRHPVNPWY